MKIPNTDDRGETLIESLISIMVLGLISTAIFVVAGLVITSSKTYRNQASSSVSIRNWAEQISAYPASGASWPNCANSGQWESFVTPPPGGSVVSVKYLNGTAFQATCPSNPDQGVQLVTIEVQVQDPNSPAAAVAQQLEVAVRKP